MWTNTIGQIQDPQAGSNSVIEASIYAPTRGGGNRAARQEKAQQLIASCKSMLEVFITGGDARTNLVSFVSVYVLSDCFSRFTAATHSGIPFFFNLIR
jgi:hypothetical protein